VRRLDVRFLIWKPVPEASICPGRI
jgi:hypothetical protein